MVSLTQAEEFAQHDDEGDEVRQAAFVAVCSARIDGQETHSPASWRDEDPIERLRRAAQHCQNALTQRILDDGTTFDADEIAHALCDLAISLALHGGQK